MITNVGRGVRMEDLTMDEQVAYSKVISDVLVDVIRDHGSAYVSDASRAVAKILNIPVAVVRYGVSYARVTGALKFDALYYRLSLPEGALVGA